MKTGLLIISIILITIAALFVANFFMNLHHFGYYLKIDDSYIFYCESDGKTVFCDNASVRILEHLGFI